MPNKSRRALLVIDVQNDYLNGKLPIEFPPVELSLGNICRAMDAAKATAVPVVVVQQIQPESAPFMAKDTPGAEIHKAVASRSRDFFIRKRMPSIFTNTEAETWLREHRINTVTLVGYMTHNCVLTTAIDAMQRGFSVEILADATGSLAYANKAGSASAEEIHRVMTVVMHSRFAAVMTTEEWRSILETGDEPERGTIFDSSQRARPDTSSP